MASTRNIDLDALKGIAILAVVFYHIGLLPFGYLGVDVFLVINGYFITHSLLYKFNKKEFSYTSFIKKRLVRLWPLLVLASIVSLIIGYFAMLPDYYENLGQSVVATNLFANNILSCITTGNYWDVVNSHKPLMHTWYVGILVQCYIIFPLIIWLITKCSKKVGQSVLILLCVAFASIYLLPLFPTAQKFYYLPFRLFEFLIGSLVAVYISEVNIKKNFKLFYIISVILVIFLCTISIPLLSNEVKVLIISLLTGVGVFFSLSGIQNGNLPSFNKFYRILALIGLMSYSIFIWHQVVIAFYKYSVTFEMHWSDYVILLILISIISVLSYYGFERVTNKLNSKRQINNLLLASVCGAIVVSSFGFFLYLNAGVFKDIPELEIKSENVHRGMHGEYCDRIYAYDRDFLDNGKIKVMGIGDSFVRDWFNVMLESEFADSLDYSYAYLGNIETKSDLYSNRVKKADIVFINRIPTKFPDNELKKEILNHKNVIGVGTKSFGETNGYPYARKNTSDYYNIRMPMIDVVKEEYSKEKNYYGDNYIDFIAPVIDEKGLMPVFTDDSLYIAPDCRHLSQGGAKYYAKILNVPTLINQILSK